MPENRQAAAGGVKLTVIVPVYNERYLVRDLLARVLAVEDPSIAELEVVVVDDGSTDGTREILRQLANNEPRPTAPRSARCCARSTAASIR